MSERPGRGVAALPIRPTRLSSEVPPKLSGGIVHRAPGLVELAINAVVGDQQVGLELIDCFLAWTRADQVHIGREPTEGDEGKDDQRLRHDDKPASI